MRKSTNSFKSATKRPNIILKIVRLYVLLPKLPTEFRKGLKKIRSKDISLKYCGLTYM